MIYLDALVVNIRDGAHVANRAAHIAVGVDMDGVKDVLIVYISSRWPQKRSAQLAVLLIRLGHSRGVTAGWLRDRIADEPGVSVSREESTATPCVRVHPECVDDGKVAGRASQLGLGRERPRRWLRLLAEREVLRLEDERGGHARDERPEWRRDLKDRHPAHGHDQSDESANLEPSVAEARLERLKQYADHR